MKMNYEDVIGIEPMVEEVLTEEDVCNLYEEYAKNGKYYNQAVEYPTVTGFINNVTYHNWDGIDHDGVIVVVREEKDADSEYYFMERTWKFNDKQPFNFYMTATPIWHALMPVNLGRSKEVSDTKTRIHTMRLENEGFTAKEFTELIIDKCIVDDLTLPDGKEISPSFCHNDIGEIRYFESIVQKKKYSEWKSDAIRRLMNNEVPAGDDLWDELCIGQLSSERINVFEVLRKRGHHIYLDGERDSFGWVTCGIVMDGKLMTSTYF